METETKFFEALGISEERKNEIIDLCKDLVFSYDKKSDAYKELCKRYSGETLAFASFVLTVFFKQLEDKITDILKSL